MTQDEVLEHVLQNDCYIYEQRIKDDGIYYYVRRNNTKKMVVLYPLRKNKVYTESAICHICQTLGDIAIPEYAKDYTNIVQDAKDKALLLNEFPNRNLN